MQDFCEVCRNFRPDAAFETEQVRRDVSFGARSVTLCSCHAYLARFFRVSTFEGLCKLFQENAGRRSWISRRSNPNELGLLRGAYGRRRSDVLPAA